ncbi:MAG: NAD(P)-binding protein [Anaerolineae bacterium]|nr:NAD(P)-binding protein [Anaerolineae bacterium]
MTQPAMPPSSSAPQVLIIGAGMSGLIAARHLHQAGRRVLVLDKGRGVGGRMATRRIQAARFDHGAQYFTARDATFASMITAWQAQGVVHKWAEGFVTPSGELKKTGEARYRGRDGMTSILKHLAEGLDVRLNTRVTQVEPLAEGWQVTSEDGQRFEASALVITAPIPQTLALLDAGSFALPPEARLILEKIDYAPCFAVLALLERPAQIPAPGGVWLSGEPVAWLSDNQQKGISDAPGVTIHGGPVFSRLHLEDDRQRVGKLLIDAALPYIGAPIVAYEVHLWRYSLPEQVYPARTLALRSPAPLLLAGDAFAGPRVEGAALSGLAAAQQLVEMLRS